MYIIKKSFKIKDSRIHILFSFTPELWRMRFFKFKRDTRKRNSFYTLFVSMILLGFQFRLIIYKKRKTWEI